MRPFLFVRFRLQFSYQCVPSVLRRHSSSVPSSSIRSSMQAVSMLNLQDISFLTISPFSRHVSKVGVYNNMYNNMYNNSFKNKVRIRRIYCYKVF